MAMIRSNSSVSTISNELNPLGGENEDVDGVERQGHQLSSLPPLVLISSMVKGFTSLTKLANPGVAVIDYNYQSTSLNRILQYIGDVLHDRKAYSICFVVHGLPGNFKLVSEKNVTLAAVKEDSEVKEFFTKMVSNFLYSDRGNDLNRIDILNCPVEENAEGKQMIQALSRLIGVPVFTSKDIWGADLSGSTEDPPIKIGTLYFDGLKLKEWSNTDNEVKLDNYELIRVVGKGAYGQAVLYRRKDDDSKVILKKINVLELKKEERQGVLTEIKILAMLDHPHVVSYYDSFEEDGVMMIEMEFAEGGSLQQYLRSQTSPLTELDVLKKFSQMVDAIRYIHMHNILHRDLKTANIFLTRIGSVKLGDFGIAKVLSATHEAAQTMVGTPYYISPEICVGKHYNSKSDIWSLGCILYEMLCLQRTFEGTNLPALIHKIVEGSFEPIKGQYSEGLKQVVMKMLQKEPTNRPSADQLHTKLVPVLLKPIQGTMESTYTDNVLPDDADTKSFLYYLDGTSLLLKPICPSFQERICNVAVGYSHIVIVTDDLNVFSWGENSHGQLGLGDTNPRNKPTHVDSLNGRNIKSAQCGGEFSIFMNENGIIMSCGRGDRGTLGHGNTRDYLKPEIIQELLSHDVSVIECGECHVVMLTKDGKLFVWGSGDCGRLGTGSGDDCLKPTEITVHSPGTRMEETVRDIRCGIDCSVFITDVGRLFACGNNTDNKLGLNQRETFLMQMKKILAKNQLIVPCKSVPTPIKELGKHRIVDCFLGVTHSVFLTESDLVYTFGRNTDAQLGAGHCIPMDMPNIVKGLNPKPMIVKSMELATIVTSESNSFYLWGCRPVVKSPLMSMFSGDDAASVRHTLASPDSGFKESPIPTRNLSPTSLENEGKRYSDPNKPIKPFTDTLKDKAECESSPKIRIKQTLEAMLTEIPHEQTKCQMSDKYVQTVVNTSTTRSSHASNKITRQTSIATTHNMKLTTKKGSRSSLEKININTDGRIISPTSINLVEESGISSSLWSQGLENIKLEDIACYGPNLIVLIYACLPKKETNTKPQRKSSFVVGQKFRRTSSLLSASISTMQIDDGANKFTLPKTVLEEKENSGEVNNVPTRAISPRPISPTTQLPTWLRRDLEDGIPTVPPISSSKPVEESHGWFPDSMRPGTPNRDNKIDNKVFPRRPSGLVDNKGLQKETNMDFMPPPVTSPDQATGIQRLPTAKMKTEPKNNVNYSRPPSVGPRLPQAKSIANLPTKSCINQDMKRVSSISNVSRQPKELERRKSKPSPVLRSNSGSNSKRGKLQKSYTTPGTQTHDDRETNNDQQNKPHVLNKVKVPSTGSPYLAHQKQHKPTKMNSSVNQTNKQIETESAAEKTKNELEKRFEMENKELKKLIEEKDHNAQENEKKFKSEIEKLNKRIEEMEVEKVAINERLLKLERKEPPPRSKICTLM